ncbi:RNA 2',3'-cyclic phosphodiesterase [bacterium]|nr:RNA 2',3'-cyclic phosphodiesterase [bacterium]
MNPIRTFLAIPLPLSLRKYLFHFRDPIKNVEDRINWIKAENIHITLNFLGDTDPESMGEQSQGLAKIVANYPAFELGTMDTGVFPHANAPRVIWVSTAAYDSTLNNFKIDLDNHLRQLGYQLDKRKFQPHITLGRVKSISRKSTFIHDFMSAEVRETNFMVNEIKWIKSDLTPTGANYEELEIFKFNTGG